MTLELTSDTRVARFPSRTRTSQDVAEHRFGRLVGMSPPMKEVYAHISRVAPTNATVLIVGESGTGKELVARRAGQLHRRRSTAPRCVRASDARHLFLDEVTEMPMELQVKLLRVLESGTFTRTGGETPLPVDIRFLAATNRQPEEAIKQAKLREDLYYRLKVFQLSLHTLRDRAEDVPLLAEHFLTQIAALEGASKRLMPEALAMLTSYAWPGNIRELKNALYSAYILAGPEITVECLPAEIRRPATLALGHTIPIKVGMTVEEVERRLILATLDHLNGSKRKAAKTLGISLKTLYNQTRKYRMQN